MPSSTPTRSNARAGLRTLALACLALLSQPAWPQPDGGTRSARARFAQAQHEYDLGRFNEALEGYTQAYELDPLPGFVFNIAQCHRQMHHWERAAFFYRRYLDLSATVPANEKVVKDLIAECEQRQAEIEQKHKDDLDQQRRVELARLEAQRAENEARAKQQQAELAAMSAPDAGPTLIPSVLPDTALVEAPPAAPASPVYKRWWFWTGVGAVAVGAAATLTYFAVTPTPTSLKDINAR
jgi:tetratricopeptide (TPR) repeat protein